MPYLGRPVTNAGQFEIIDDISSDFDGSETSFSLKVGGTDIQPDVANVTITLGGVYQVPASAYSITGSTINFSEAPESSTAFHGVLAGQSQFIESDFITNTMIKSTANISGSKINTDFSGKTVKAAIFDGMVSSSAQIADNISGSLSQVHLSSKISGIVSASSIASSAQGQVALTTNGVAATAVDLGLQSGDSPTFAGGTITGDFSVGGTLTAQEIHTEFESASIIFTSGSTQFGNSPDDNHVFSGSLLVTGSIVQLRGDSTKLRFSNDAGAERAFLQLNSTGLNIDTDSFIDFKPNNTFAARFDSNGRLGIGTNNPATLLHVSKSNGSVRFTFGSDSELTFGRDANGVYQYVGSNQHLRFLYDNGSSEAMRIKDGGFVGIGTNNPGAILDVDSGATGESDSEGCGIRVTLQRNGSAQGLTLRHEDASGGSTDASEGTSIQFQGYDGSNSYHNLAAIFGRADGESVSDSDSPGFLTFHTTPDGSDSFSERMRITSAGLVGIGETSPSATLHIKNTGGTSYGQFVTLEGDTSDNNNYPGIVFKGGTLANNYPNIGLTNGGLATSISGGYHSSNYNTRTNILLQGSDGSISFSTGESGSSTERMRITSGGKVGIGTNNPATQVHIFDDSAQTELRVESNNDDAKLTLDATSNKDPQISMQANGSEKWKIRNKTDATNTFEILNGDGDGIKIEDDGDLDVRTGDILFSTSGKGICLGVTSNTDSNTLDDYEEGTYTPSDSSAGASLSFSSAQGRYVKIGTLCFVTLSLTFPSTSNGATPRISVPFTTANDGVNAVGNVFPPGDDGISNAANGLIVRTNANQTYIELIRKKEGSDADNADLSGASISISITFRTT